MRVLLVYASRHGATKGIADRIASTIRQRGIDVTVQSAEDAGGVDGFDAVIVGSAAYAFHWLTQAIGFVRRNRFELLERPVWLFSSGPLGTETTDAEGRDVRSTAEPREFTELRAAIHPRGERVFFGAYDPASKPVGLMERVTRMMPATKDLMPAGDFRDWDEIEAWAATIADELSPVLAGRG